MLRRYGPLIVAALLLAIPFEGRGQPVDSLEGTWVLDRIERQHGPTVTDPGPALLVFTRSHVSMTMLRGDSLPRFEDPGSPTRAEKADVYDRLSSTAGPYRVRGDTLVIRPYVAKRPRAMQGWPDRTETFLFGVDGDRLRFVLPNATLIFGRVEGRLDEDRPRPGEAGPEPGVENEAGSGERQGKLRVDGSSAVYPVSEAMAERFARSDPGVRVTVESSGTRESFRRLCRGEVDVIGVSGPIEQRVERLCEANGVEPGRVPVARDGITLAVNAGNDWAQCMTLDELRRAWSTVESWKDLRDSWPDRELRRVAPLGNGTYADFVKAVDGAMNAGRSDYSRSTDANVTVSRIAESEGALGLLPFAYARANGDRIRTLAVDDGSGCVEPSTESIESGAYDPLTRQLSILVDLESLRRRPEVRSFVTFYLEKAGDIVSEAGYVPLRPTLYDTIRERVESVAEDGSADSGATGRVTVSWEDVSFTVRRPSGWSYTDVSELTGGTLEAAVFMRDPRVAERQYGSDFSLSTEDTLSVGSPGNVILSLARVPVEASRAESAEFLREMVASTVRRLLPEGEVTGEPRRRKVGEDSVMAVPFRGRDRENRRVRGFQALAPIAGTTVQGQLIVGPEAPPAAVDSAERALESLRPRNER